MQVKNFIKAFGIEKLNGKAIQQNGKKKIDFNNTNFNSTMDFIGFLRNEKLITQILGY